MWRRSSRMLADQALVAITTLPAFTLPEAVCTTGRASRVKRCARACPRTPALPPRGMPGAGRGRAGRAGWWRPLRSSVPARCAGEPLRAADLRGRDVTNASGFAAAQRRRCRPRRPPRLVRVVHSHPPRTISRVDRVFLAETPRSRRSPVPTRGRSPARRRRGRAFCSDGNFAHHDSTNPPFRPDAPPPQMSCSSSTTSQSGASRLISYAVHRPTNPPPMMHTLGARGLAQRRCVGFIAEGLQQPQGADAAHLSPTHPTVNKRSLAPFIHGASSVAKPLRVGAAL